MNTMTALNTRWAAWAVFGMLLAPILLRRMARRQSGSAVAVARQRILSAGY
jgi:ABC-2 type transport system permease protein